jgi:hypothetical protein
MCSLKLGARRRVRLITIHYGGAIVQQYDARTGAINAQRTQGT